jgi:hypothetical protein
MAAECSDQIAQGAKTQLVPPTRSRPASTVAGIVIAGGPNQTVSNAPHRGSPRAPGARSLPHPERALPRPTQFALRPRGDDYIPGGSLRHGGGSAPLVRPQASVLRHVDTPPTPQPLRYSPLASTARRQPALPRAMREQGPVTARAGVPLPRAPDLGARRRGGGVPASSSLWFPLRHPVPRKSATRRGGSSARRRPSPAASTRGRRDRSPSRGPSR